MLMRPAAINAVNELKRNFFRGAQSASTACADIVLDNLKVINFKTSEDKNNNIYASGMRCQLNIRKMDVRKR